MHLDIGYASVVLLLVIVVELGLIFNRLPQNK